MGGQRTFSLVLALLLIFSFSTFWGCTRTAPAPGELARVVDFSVGISEVEREENKAVLHFVITKVADAKAGHQSLPLVLIDDHGNEYRGQLSIDLGGASEFVLGALPEGFTYVEVLEISMPKMAPIKSMRLGDRETAYEKIKFGDPQFAEEFGSLVVAKGQSVQVGEWLSFTMGQAIPESPSWKLPITVENKEYNPRPAEASVGVQNRDGTISWGGSKTGDVPAQSSTSVSLSLPLQETPPQPRMLMLEYIDQRSQERVLGVFPMPPSKLLPFAVSGKIYQKWMEEGFGLGLPTGNEVPVASGVEGSSTTGLVQSFEGGDIHYVTTGTNAAQGFEIHRGLLLDLYAKLGGSTSWLGFPIMDQYVATSGHPQAEFEAGYIATADGRSFQAFPYGPGMIAFTSDRDGNEEIYVTDPSGRHQVNLTKNPANDRHPSWSPDGTKIAFVSDREPKGIYLMNKDGSNVRFVAEGEHPAWFPDGSRIIFSKPRERVETYFGGLTEKFYENRLFTANVDGNDLRQISPDPETAEVSDFDFLRKLNFNNSVISPDGSRIAFSAGDWESGWNYGVYIMNLDGTELRSLVGRGFAMPGGDNPSWSPDGSRIAYRGDRGEFIPGIGHGGALHTVDAGAARASEPIDFYYKEDSEIWAFGGLDWAPDGDEIIFGGRAGECNMLYITHVRERILRRLPGQGNNYQPDWGQAGGMSTAPTPASTATKADLVKSLRDLKDAMLKKVDSDVDVTAIAFTDVKSYWRAKRWVDILRTPLRIIEDTIGILKMATDWSSIVKEGDRLLDSSEANWEIASLMMMLQDLREVGGQLGLALDGPTYASAVRDMLEAADATFVPPSGDDWQKHYQDVIENHLYATPGTEIVGPLVIPRRATTTRREMANVVHGAFEVRQSIQETFDELISTVESKELPPDFPLDKVIAQLNELEMKVIKSQSWAVDDVKYQTYLQDGGKYVLQSVETSLGAVGSRYTFFGQVAANLDKKLEIEAKVEVLKAVGAAGNAILLYTNNYKIQGAEEETQVLDKMIVPAELALKGFSKVFYPDAEETFYMLPQEMVFALPGELSSLWMIADDTDQYLRHLLGEVDFATKSVATIVPTTGPVGTEITVNGIGFVADVVVTITYDGTQVAAGTSDRDGSFGAVFVAPPSTSGNHTITVSDGYNTVQCTFTIRL